MPLFRRVPMALSLLCIGALVAPLMVRPGAYPCRLCIYLVRIATAVCICALAFATRAAIRSVIGCGHDPVAREFLRPHVSTLPRHISQLLIKTPNEETYGAARFWNGAAGSQDLWSHQGHSGPSWCHRGSLELVSTVKNLSASGW